MSEKQPINERERWIQAVIFDLDDTLIDWSQPQMSWADYTRPMTDRLHGFLSNAGHRLPASDEFYTCLSQEVQREWDSARAEWKGASFREALRRTLQICDVDASRIDIEELMRAYDWQPMPGVVLFDDALHVLAELRRRGYKLGLITNSFLPMWMRDVELRHYELIDLFDARTTSGDAGYMKPHPAIYRQMMAELDVAPGRSLFVGDRPEHDIAGANKAGMISVLMDPPHLQREVGENKPDFTIETLSELLEILERLEIGRVEIGD